MVTVTGLAEKASDVFGLTTIGNRLGFGDGLKTRAEIKYGDIHLDLAAKNPGKATEYLTAALESYDAALTRISRKAQLDLPRAFSESLSRRDYLFKYVPTEAQQWSSSDKVSRFDMMESLAIKADFCAAMLGRLETAKIMKEQQPKDKYDDYVALNKQELKHFAANISSASKPFIAQFRKELSEFAGL